MVQACRACDSMQLSSLLDCGELPLSHHLSTSKEEALALARMRLGICEQCETIQWSEGWTSNYFQSDRNLYREPERHLDTIAAQLQTLPLPKAFRIGLASEKDRSLANRLTGGSISNEPPYDLLLARHIAEHSDLLSQSITEWRSQISPNGFIYLEVPDASQAIKTGDVTVLWEQHRLYFSSLTLRRALAMSGLFSTEIFLPREESRNEGILAVIAHSHSDPQLLTGGEEKRLALAFPFRVAQQKKFWENYLEGKKVAALGAGHDLITFLNIHHLGRYLEFVADDDPEKLGRFLPGSQLPILPVTAVRRSRVDFCLLAVNAESEERALTRLTDFREQGGEVVSIYSLSSLAPPTVHQLS